MLAVTNGGRLFNPGIPKDNIRQAKIISAIIATNKFLPIACLQNLVGVRTTKILNMPEKNREANP
jgi:hypothetical protein